MTNLWQLYSQHFIDVAVSACLILSNNIYLTKWQDGYSEKHIACHDSKYHESVIIRCNLTNEMSFRWGHTRFSFYFENLNFLDFFGQIVHFVKHCLIQMIGDNGSELKCELEVVLDLDP